MKKIILLSVLILLISLAYSFADVPCKINYQGRLIKDNVPVDGTKTMVFSIYPDAVGGTLPLWTSGDADITVYNGLFRYVLDLSSINWTADQELYLEVKVGSDILTPREAISANPYAINSHLLEGATKEYFLNTSGETQKKDGGLNIMGNLGIGTTSPQAKLHVGGVAGTDGIRFPDGTIQTSSSGKIRCRVFHNTTQSIINNFSQLINFNSESWDTDNMHGPTNNFSLFCNTPGLYLISASVRWASRTGGKRGCWIVKAGIGVDDRLAGNEADSVAGDCYNNVTTIALLNVGDQIRVHVYQNSGSALNLDTSLAHWPYYTSYPSLTMVRIGD